jgi:hypothetical protein
LLQAITRGKNEWERRREREKERGEGRRKEREYGTWGWVAETGSRASMRNEEKPTWKKKGKEETKIGVFNGEEKKRYHE